MDAVSIRAVFGSHDLHPMYFDVLASIDYYVEQLTVERRQPCDNNVVRIAESKCLLANEHTK